MNRNHTIDEYLEIIHKLKEEKPSIKFSSDFIIAYPGETLFDFEKSISLMKQVEFINSYSFIFSARPGTPAANLKKIEEKSAKERLVIFQRLADEVKTKYRKKLVNTITRVLFENNTRGNNKYFGRDEYFNSVIVNSKEDLAGKIRNVKIDSCNQNTLFGEVILENKQKECAA